MASTLSSTKHGAEGLSEGGDNESKNKHLPPGSCRKLLPEVSTDLIKVIVDSSSMSSSILSLLETTVNLLYKGEYCSCLDLCQPALDKIWEELNTGYWKDVPLCWRQAYSLVSLAKALCESALLSEPGRNIDHAVILRTCDMGLLMGAPILGNILARMSREFQRAFGILGQWRRLSESAQGDPDAEAFTSSDGMEADKRLDKISEAESDKDSEKIESKIEIDMADPQEREGSNKGDIESQKIHDKKTANSSPAAKRARICSKSNSSELSTKTNSKAPSIGSENFADDSELTDNLKQEGIMKTAEDPSSLSTPVITLPPTVHTQKTNEIPRCSCPSVEMFQAMFMDVGHPVIITDAIGYWPALTTRRWTLDYLISVAGCRTVPVEIGERYTEESWTQKLMTIGEMIDQYVTKASTDKAYLAQHQLFDQVWELRDDISVPVYCCLGEDEDVDTNAWFGPAGTISPLHQDPKHNFFCQVMGKKYVRLYSEEHTECVYPHQTRLLHNTSQVDIDEPDLEQFPMFKDIPCLEAVLRPGEMLYIPPKHWHYVKSLAISFSVSFWWQ